MNMGVEHLKNGLTCAIHIYSTKTEATFMAKVTRTAIRVDASATREIVNGPMSLQKRSIRRIRAFTTRLVNSCHLLFALLSHLFGRPRFLL